MATSNQVISAKIANGVYKELEEGLSGGCDDRGEFEIKQYLSFWSDRSNLIREMKGLSRISGGSSGTWTTVLPYQLPDNPSLYARDIAFVPEGALIPGVTPIAFSHARHTVTFRKPDFNFQAQDDPGFLNSLSQDAAENAAMIYATQELDFGKEWVAVPNSSVKFKSDNVVPVTTGSRSITTIAMKLTWHRYPVMPMNLVRSYVDCVNDAIFLGCPIGTCLFEGCNTVREASSDGTVTQRVQMNFKFRQYNWNMKLRDDKLLFEFVVDKAYAGGALGDSTGAETYQYKNFSKLLLTR